MVLRAEALASGTDFLRVDLYLVDTKPYFGEFAVYPYSGRATFVPADERASRDSVDRELGALWPQRKFE